ncbi:bifunctional diguanylate cyclase/phosphodiesterase [Helicovermis profundi]|uniref:Diguanylate cyclase/phosphodiesterase n=1 Tax=Helicovermis profundi TaxID=3065157 RepID=A0AAU9E8V1_9FIRM|nr:hypothetical protein HLPR_05280 [Clostridia bacterium S502]
MKRKNKIDLDLLKYSFQKTLKFILVYIVVILVYTLTIEKIFVNIFGEIPIVHRISYITLNVLIMVTIMMKGIYNKNKNINIIKDNNRRLNRKIHDFKVLKNKLQIILNLSSDGIFDWDVVKDDLYISNKAKNIFGIKLDLNCGSSKCFSHLFNEEEIEKFKIMINYFINSDTSENTYTMNIKAKNSNQRVVKIYSKTIINKKDGRILRIYGSISDVTLEKSNEKRIYNLAYFDKLTSLPNRYRFKEKVQSLINEGKTFALFLIDIDNFSHINESYGYEVGDKILIETAKRIKSINMDFEIISRLGSDEFIVVYSGDITETMLENISKKIINIFQLPVNIDDNLHHIEISIGISEFPKLSSDYSNLLKKADIALKEIKNNTKGSFRIFDEVLEYTKMRELFIYNNLKGAIPNNEFYLVFQPKIDLRTNQIVGAESLIRWQKDDRLISPSEFIEISEKTGYIEKISLWVLVETCKKIKLIEKFIGNDFRISINISYVEFSKTNFVDNFLNILKLENVDTSKIEIEITERTVVGNLDESAKKLSILREKNICISLDDFGTGYSSLSYLQKLPIDFIKLDKSFLDTIESSKNEEVLKSVIELAHNIKIKTIAEGIETEEDVRVLKEANCDFVQGYYYYRPLEFDDFFTQIKCEVKKL